MFLYKGALQNGTFKQQKKALKTLWEHFFRVYPGLPNDLIMATK